jgi:hypothetical protein
VYIHIYVRGMKIQRNSNQYQIEVHTFKDDNDECDNIDDD